MVQVGDDIPSISLCEENPSDYVDLKKELAEGNGLIIGVPAAFSPTCSDTHIPDYISSPSLSSAGKVFVVSVNDAFVMRAWGKSLDKEKKSGIRFLGDATGAFTKALSVDFDATSVLGNVRSKRYAIKTVDGKVSGVFIEPDKTGLDVSAAQKILA
ncbi:Peroxisomal membrane associated protein 20 [Golovinomyces cichoracearum]|uniref:Peroxisomal membrane associated protein 20 n=1 Tax=Golovinomyces cichoracearum TaxID=62708 RepID=A0A420IL90_9PEZI|nr:Peroxisomal membrane associated protein 20 [Golovinomyces cichoracearum]